MQSKHLRIASAVLPLSLAIVLSGAGLASAANAPAITSISPDTGSISGGTSVTISGTGFSGATAVDFGTTPGVIIATTSDTSLTATAPAMNAAGVEDISIMTPNGTSATSSADQFTYTAPATSTPTTTPVISDITVTNIDPTDATVNWTTDSNSTSQVIYGTNTYYGASTVEDTTPVTSHSQILYGLTPGTPYHFYVASTNGIGTATSSDMTFTTGGTSSSTTPTASSTPLALTGVTAIQGNAIADGSFADGWQWMLQFSVPTSENYLSMKFADFTNGSGGDIPAANDIMFYSPQSSNASTQSSALTETNNDYTGFLNLTDASSTAPDQTVDVYVDVAVPSGTPIGTYSTTFGALSTTTATSTP